MKERLFTAGPVAMFPDTLYIGGQQSPYFRTEEFSRTVLETESWMCALAGAPAESRMVLLTCSGSGAMEAAVLNAVGPGDRVLIIVGGDFGQRFCDICTVHGIAFDAIRLSPGHTMAAEQIESLALENYHALLVNAHETSTGVLYDLMRLGQACARAGTLFIVDAVSSFLCDPIHMQQMSIDTLITSSQKALALEPGLSLLLLGPRSIALARAGKVQSHYFALNRYLADGQRGQTPFTPAVTVVLQLHQRARSLVTAGARLETTRCAQLAHHFRASLNGLPLRMFPDLPSNALTALQPTDGCSAFEIFQQLRSRFGLVVTPNGGSLKHTLFRVGHMGNLSHADLDQLSDALKEIMQ
jgi:aspartate aminotransferase-like enzyme